MSRYTAMQKRCLSIPVWLTVVFFLSPLTSSAEDNNESSARQLYENALRVYNAENYLKTITLLDKIITDYPESRYSQKSVYLTRLLLQYKMSLKELKDLEEEKYKIPGLNPHYLQGIIYHQEGKRNEAFAEFQDILINPTMKRWWPYANEIVQSYKPDMDILRKDPVKAVKMFESILEMTDPADKSTKRDIDYALLELCKEAGMIKEVIRKKETELIQVENKLIEAYGKTARLYEKNKDYEKAARMYRKVLALSPQDNELKKSLESVEKLINKTRR